MLFTSEHEQLRGTIRRVVDQDINPNVDAWEEAETFPAHQLFAKLGAAGLLGITKDPAYGGMGLDWSYGLVLAEELGRVTCAGIPMAIGVQTDMCTPALNRFASDALKKEFLAPSIAGQLVGAIGVSEPGAGSDVAGIKTRARKDGDDYVISGTKMWITNGMQADWMCCLVNTSDGPPHLNKSLVVVPFSAPGVQRARKIKKIGMWSSDTAQIFLDEVRIPQRYRIGDEGAGFTYQMLQFQEERLWVAANATICLERCIASTIDYTRERKIFGGSVLDQQVVHFRLAELATEVEALRALTHRAVELHVRGENVTRLAAMAKLKAGRLGREVSDACLQFWGGMGFSWESSISRMYRDLRLISIGGGADEVMLGIICKLDGTLPRRAG
ncbi:MAG: citronellyl-CoA dehydrogenase [Myxococcales bacterium]|jgi:citronellyl-CoA dehydrogenase|nr:citronellyl-CoA dehydrogenase [Myxococcales bacterium]